MAPIVDPLETGATFVDSYKGIGILFVGLAGGILIFKSTKSIQNRMTFLMIGFALLIICSVFIAEFSGKSFFSTFFEWLRHQSTNKIHEGEVELKSHADLFSLTQ